MTSAGAPLRRLVRRAQFLRAARGSRAGRTAFALQAIPADDSIPGVGFTVTKKTGNSPERNRIRRRLREAARACATQFRPRHDYVLVGRREALNAPFTLLVKDLAALIARVHRPAKAGVKSDSPVRPQRGEPTTATPPEPFEP